MTAWGMLFETLIFVIYFLFYEQKTMPIVLNSILILVNGMMSCAIQNMKIFLYVKKMVRQTTHTYTYLPTTSEMSEKIHNLTFRVKIFSSMSRTLFFQMRWKSYQGPRYRLLIKLFCFLMKLGEVAVPISTYIFLICS